MRLAFAFSLLLAGPAISGHEDDYEGCTAFLTVQAQGCVLENIYRCDNAFGQYSQHVYFRKTGISRTVSRNPAGGELTTTPEGSASITVIQPEEDPYSLEELLSTGKMSYAYRQEFHENGTIMDNVGTVTATGATVDVDGHVLEEFAYEEVVTGEGRFVERSTGVVLVSREWGIAFMAVGKHEPSIGTGYETDRTPVEFLLEGEDGFMSDVPKHGCEG